MPHAVVAPATTSEVLHVLDLPQIYAKPSADQLLEGLALLSIQVPSWDRVDSAGQANVVKSTGTNGRCQVAPEGITKYLTSIIASDLRWVEDDDQKEAIWDMTSLRMAERSGRTGMPAMTRSFKIPNGNVEFEISIHEPSLTGDNVGFKTWAASYLLSKRLHTIALPVPGEGAPRILELGSGTGLVGMAAAAALGASVLLTDMAEIEGNLARNVVQNEAVITQHGGRAQTATLDWTNPTEIIPSASSMCDDEALTTGSFFRFPIILAADSIYSAEHPAMLVEAIKTWLSSGADARVIVEMPRRDGYFSELEDFKQRMLSIGLSILEEGEETGYDDWGGDSEDELADVNCWWAIWGWSLVRTHDLKDTSNTIKIEIDV